MANSVESVNSSLIHRGSTLFVWICQLDSADYYCSAYIENMPGPVARSDAPPPGMQMVAGSVLVSGHEIISMAILSLSLIQAGQNFVSYWRKNIP